MSDELMAALAAFQTCIETRDRAAAERVLDESYALVLVAPSGAVMPRARWLEVLEDCVIEDYAIEDQIVHEADELAPVLQRVRMQATVLGEDRSGTFVLSDIWRRRDGQMAFVASALHAPNGGPPLFFDGR